MPHAAMECLLRQASENLIDGDAFRALLHVCRCFRSAVWSSSAMGARPSAAPQRQQLQSPIVLIIEDENGEETDPLDESQIIDPLQHKLKISQFLPSPGRTEIGLTAEIQVLKRR